MTVEYIRVSLIFIFYCRVATTVHSTGIFKTEKRKAASVTENLAQTGVLSRAALQQQSNYFINEFIFWAIRRFITTLT